MVFMNATVTLYNPSQGYRDEVTVENIADKRCFTYSDNDQNQCELCIYDDGLCFFKEEKDHLLELHLKSDAYAKIITEEGTLKFNVKVVEFILNSDILIIRYLIDDEERIINIKYY